MKIYFLLGCLLFMSNISIAQEDHNTTSPSYFVPDFGKDLFEEVKIHQLDSIQVLEKTFINEQSEFIIMAVETIYPDLYIESKDKDEIQSLLETIHQKGLDKFNELVQPEIENSHKKHQIYRKKFPSFYHTATYNGLNFKSRTIYYMNQFFQVMMMGNTNSADAESFFNNLQIIELE